jgi:hypothetical protein
MFIIQVSEDSVDAFNYAGPTPEVNKSQNR